MENNEQQICEVIIFNTQSFNSFGGLGIFIRLQLEIISFFLQLKMETIEKIRS